MEEFKERTQWGFKDMQQGEVIRLSEAEFNLPKAQGYAHVYGRCAGKKFETRIVSGVLIVKRIQ